MSAVGERTLIQSLSDVDSLEVLAREGLPAEAIPNVLLRPVVDFSVNYFHQSGRSRAPSFEVLANHFGDLLSDQQILLEEPEDTIEWAIDDLRADHGTLIGQQFVKDLAIALNEAREAGDPALIPGVINEYASLLTALAMELGSRAQSVEVHEGMQERLLAYEGRAANRGVFTGATMGFPEIDAHVFGVQPGELAILAAPPKVGKSFYLCLAGLRDWQRGRDTVVWSLENSVAMTLDRIGCIAMGIDSRAWQRGESTDIEKERMGLWVNEILPETPQQLYVLQPPMGKRTVEQMVRESQLRSVKTILIDQLSFIELPSPRKPKTERIGEALHLLKVMISDPRDPLSCIVANQINREGLVAARKVGHLLMDHMADSAEIERTADWVFGLWQSEDARAAKQMLIQILAARREDITNWMLGWNVGAGMFSVRHEKKDLDNG